MLIHIILHDTSGSFLLVKNNDSELLLTVPNAAPWQRGCFLARLLYREITKEDPYGFRDAPLAVRYSIDYKSKEDRVWAYIMEPIGRRSTIPLHSDYIWTKIDDALIKRMEDRYSPLLVQDVKNIRAETSEDFENDSVPWFAAGGFVKRVRETIRSRLKECGYIVTGSVDQMYSSPDSMHFTIDTDKGLMFYKISGYGCPEALFTQTLARVAPDHVVTPFGVDIKDNSFFTKSFGVTLADFLQECDDEEVKKYKTDKAIDTIAEFHKKASGYVEELKELGMEDTSPQRIRKELPQFICELKDRGVLSEEQVRKMRALVPVIVSILNELADGKIPLTVCHGDLLYGNVTNPREEGEDPLLFDWYESSVSHPFLDFMYDDFAKPPLREMYASKWLKYESSDKLMHMLAMAGDLIPLWESFHQVKVILKRGHQLGAEKDWNQCRIQMTHFINSLWIDREMFGIDNS